MNDRVVWFDLPVTDLERASKFYGAVLGIKVSQENAGGFKFAVLDHGGRKRRLPRARQARR